MDSVQAGPKSAQFTEGPFFSIDVECVATGTDHNSRAVGHIAVVNQFEQVLLNVYVKPASPVVSYLSPLTGLTADIVNAYGVPLAQAVQMVKASIPKNAVLVGQSIRKDVEWLGLREGVDFASLIDLAGLFRVWNPQYSSWSVFGQDHVAKVLLNWCTVEQQEANGGNEHNALIDSIKSIRLFNHYNQLQADSEAWQQAQKALLAAPAAPSFARRNPVFEGVCMGNRKTCKCGAPFLSN